MLALVYDWVNLISPLQWGLFVTFITLCYLYRKSQFTLFQRLGVQGPVPSIVWGNSAEIFSKGMLHLEQKWSKEYGSMFGVYYGPKPTLFVSDPDAIRDVAIKHFNKFINRTRFPLEIPYPTNMILFQLRDEDWRRVRTLMSPSFTANKLKCTSVLVDKCAKRFADVIASKNSTEIEFKELSEAMALDVIGNCVFGVNCNTQMDENDSFLVMIRTWMKEIFRPSIYLVLALLFPGLRPILSFMRWNLRFGRLPSQDLVDLVKDVIAQRRSDESMRRPDMLQILLDAASDPNTDVGSSQKDEQENVKQYRTLSEYEIVGQCFVFLFAGYDTISRSIAFTMYLLIVHPDIQEKVYQEIREQTNIEDEITYDSLKRMTYLDMVMNESTRLMPGTSGIFRECTETCKLGDVIVPKGLNIHVPGFAIQRDPSVWPNPDEFLPDRFSPENKASLPPYGLLTFGIGPRNCIGNRFALLEIKTSIVRILQRFKLVENENTKSRFKYEPLTFPFSKPSTWKVFCKVESR